MRLWGKITAICGMVMILVMSISFFAVLQLLEHTLYRTQEENAKKSLAMYCSNIISASEASAVGVRQTTLKSIVQYYFSDYAALVQTDEVFFSLVSGRQYLFDRSPYDPASQLPSVQDREGDDRPQESRVQFKHIRKEGAAVLIGCLPFSVAGQQFDAYITMDISSTQRQIVILWVLSLGVLLLACAAVGTAVALLVRRALSPIDSLTKSSVSISNGQYHLRTNYKGNDEIGTLSVAFDKMADSIEETVTSLDLELHKQQLLVGALSHEIKTPMTAMMGYADAFLRMPLSEEQKIECARKIYHAGKHMEKLTQKMMELVGMMDMGEIEKTAIPVPEFADHLRELLPPQTKIRYDARRLWGDESLLISLVSNLVRNAFRASGENPQVCVDITEKGSFTQIIVSDKGCGIPPEQIPLITEPFYRVDKARSREHGGAGLGLAICKKICEYHGGGLAFESRVGQGTTVTASIITN